MFEIEDGGALILLSLLLMTAGSLFVLASKSSKVPEVKPISTQSGFSLIELMMVIVILGILSGLGNSVLVSMREVERVESTSATIRGMMMAARINAMATGETQYVGVLIGGSSFASTVGNNSSTYNPATDVWAFGSDTVEATNVQFLDSNVDGSAPAAPVPLKTFTFSSSGVSNVVGESAFLIKHANDPEVMSKIIVVSTFTGKVRVDDCSLPGKNCQ